MAFCCPLSGEPERDHRQVRGGQAELAQHLPGAPGGGVVKAGRDPVPGEQVPQLLRPRRPVLADHPRRLEAAAALAGPLPQELGHRAVELLIRGLHRADYPVVDRAQGDRVEDRAHGLPVTPGHRGYPQGGRVDAAGRGQYLDAIRVLRADPADDQRHRQASGLQVPHPGCQLRWPAADHDLIVRAIPPGQLPVQALPDASITADDDDGRLGPASLTVSGGSQLLISSGGNAR